MKVKFGDVPVGHALTCQILGVEAFFIKLDSRGCPKMKANVVTGAWGVG